MLDKIFEPDKTATLSPAELLEQLTAFEQTDSVTRFNQLYQAIEWQTVAAPHFIKAIELAIWFNLPERAAHLAQRGQERFPAHTDLHYWAQVLAPPQVVSQTPVAEETGQARETGQQASAHWFKTQADRYRGQWVAVQDGQLLATATTRQAVVDQLKQRDVESQPIVTRVL